MGNLKRSMPSRCAREGAVACRKSRLQDMTEERFTREFDPVALRQQFCVNHPDRMAIGICVVTHKAICSECSTRYEGVNYSIEGLAILKQQRADAARRAGAGRSMLAILAVALTPLLLYLVYLSYTATAKALITLLHD